MAKGETKNRLLEVGTRIFLERGYNHSGIEAILQAADVPKGSFYNYFSSKEDFGLQVINRFAECYDAELDRCLADRSAGPLARLRGYFESVIGLLESNRCRSGCLVGNLSQEMADQSELLRARLEEVFEGWADRYAGCLELAREAGEIPAETDVRSLAEFWLNSWQGAVLRAKTAKTTRPLRLFLEMTFGSIAPPAATKDFAGRDFTGGTATVGDRT